MGGDSSARRLAAFRSLAGNRALARVVGGYALFILELGTVPRETGLADSVAAKLAIANPGYFETTPPAS